uniref:Uncharacterized protein n=1 Tax=Cacopsylla melanoneura TaxID=428564 RepID=A0A8D8XA24_9HEMI
MYILLACLSLAVLAYSDDSKHYLKYPAPASIEPAAHPVERKPHDSVGATYQAITKRHYTASQHYDLQHIVNDPEHSRTPSTYTYRIPPNQTDDYPPAPRVSPKAFSYQPVITIANNMKSFYKTFNYDPFVVPQPPAPEQYYAGNYLNNLIYPGSEYP